MNSNYIDKSKNELINIAIGLSLKKMRRGKSLTGQELASILNVTQQQISRYERGVNKLSVSQLMCFLQNLNYDFDQFSYIFLDCIKEISPNNYMEFCLTFNNKFNNSLKLEMNKNYIQSETICFQNLI